MSKGEELDRVARARLEMGDAVLGDRRLEVRLERIVEALARRPSESLPKAMEREDALEGTYRFLGNERVSAEAILAPHRARTLERCGEHARVLALFDTTELSFGGKREGLGQLKGDKGRGLLAHVGLALSADGKRTALGVLHLETIVRRDSARSRQAESSEREPESRRWGRGASSVHALLPRAICVMDREGDIFELIEQMSRVALAGASCQLARPARQARHDPVVADHAPGAAAAAPQESRQTAGRAAHRQGRHLGNCWPRRAHQEQRRPRIPRSGPRNG